MDTRIVVAVCTLIGLAACQSERRPVTAPQPSAVPTATEDQTTSSERVGARNPLTRVADPSLVCMVNNQYMGRPQIPVNVEGSTYYGCCEMCKGRLASDASARTAVDPISERPVDKAVAVIGRAEDGSTLYFENDSNFLAYNRK